MYFQIKMEQKSDFNRCHLSVSINDQVEWSETISCSDSYIDDLKIYVAGSYARQSGIATGEVRYMKFETD